MSQDDKVRRVSRRGMLAIAGLTPAVLLTLSCSSAVAREVDVATATHKPKDDSGDRFGEICKHLWNAFLKGTGETKLGLDVLPVAVDLVCPHVVSNLAQFPDDNQDVQTLYCAWVCGKKAADKAGANGTINEDNFREAYEETKADAAALLARVRGTSNMSGLAC